MNIEIEEIEENEDGSAVFKIDCDAEATKMLIEKGFIQLIREFIKDHEND